MQENPGKRLLVVDDEEAFCRFVRRTAEAENWKVEAVTRSRDFSAAFESFSPDLIMLDIIMPELDGIEVIRWLADKGVHTRLAIITGYNPAYARMAAAIAEGAGRLEVLTLSKPIRVAELRALLRGEPPSGNMPAANGC